MGAEFHQSDVRTAEKRGRFMPPTALGRSTRSTDLTLLSLVCYTYNIIHTKPKTQNRKKEPQMSMLAARMEKMKSGNLSGIQKHNQRQFKNHSNKDIIPEKEGLNYDLVNPEKIDYEEKVKGIIDSQRSEGQRAIRKDAVLVNEWIITSDKEFFNKLNNEDRARFFEVSLAYFVQKFGAENVAYAQVHLDESTPHMHLGVVPMQDGVLSGKKVFSRGVLREIQDDLPKFLQEHGFEIDRGQRGQDKKRIKHLSTEVYKETVNKAKNEAWAEAKKDLKDVHAIKENAVVAKGFKGKLADYEKRLPKTITGKKIAEGPEYEKMKSYFVGVAKEAVNDAVRTQNATYKLEQAEKAKDTATEKQKKAEKRRDELLTENKELSDDNFFLKQDNEALIDILEEKGITRPSQAELSARGILMRIERGVKPKNKDVARNWLKTLENAPEGRIEPSRLQRAIGYLERFLNGIRDRFRGVDR